MALTFVQMIELGCTTQNETFSIWMVVAVRWPTSKVGQQVSIIYLLFSQCLHTRQTLRIAVDDNTEEGGDHLDGKQNKKNGED